MTHQEILERAIQKAIDGGWLPYFATFDLNMNQANIRFTVTEGASDVRFDVEEKGRIYGASGYSLEIPSIIFSHDFAKALWGESEPVTEVLENKITVKSISKGWKHHLQQMVIADDPIEYLGENI